MWKSFKKKIFLPSRRGPSSSLSLPLISFHFWRRNRKEKETCIKNFFTVKSVFKLYFMLFDLLESCLLILLLSLSLFLPPYSFHVTKNDRSPCSKTFVAEVREREREKDKEEFSVSPSLPFSDSLKKEFVKKFVSTFFRERKNVLKYVRRGNTFWWWKERKREYLTWRMIACVIVFPLLSLSILSSLYSLLFKFVMYQH